MPSTSTWALPYPAGTQVPNVPADMQALAVATDTALSVATADIGGEMRATASQAITTGVGNKLTFGTVVTAASGITWNGTDTWTVVTAGIYAGFVNLRTALNPCSGALHVSGSTYSDSTLLFPGSSMAGGYGDFSHNFIGFLPAGTALCAWFYDASASTTTAFATRPPMFKVWRVG